MNPELVTAAAALPVSLAEAKLWLHVDDSERDTLITSLIEAATTEFEDLSGRALIASTWDYIMESWPRGDSIDLPKGQLVSVTSVKYFIEDGTEQTLSSTNYEVDVAEGSVELKRSVAWPSEVLRVSRQIVVRFVAGWANAAAVPPDIKSALKLKIQQYFDQPSTIGVGNTQIELAAMDRLWLNTVERYKLYQ